MIGEKQIEMLNEIKRYLDEYGASYKIIIYPEPDARSFNTDDFRILQNIFGKDNVFNYTGSNEITTNKENYIDDIHARSFVGDKILKDIYSRSNLKADR
ncbi:MAG: hypothetical protein EHM58_08030 [Ignavibacteriae bacterium]|nr:MAG: hypothetical protein EHM58_08030 [Ignavibacteriota bacterium]